MIIFQIVINLNLRYIASTENLRQVYSGVKKISKVEHFTTKQKLLYKYMIKRKVNIKNRQFYILPVVGISLRKQILEYYTHGIKTLMYIIQ